MKKTITFFRDVNDRASIFCAIFFIFVLLLASCYSIVKAGTIDWTDDNLTTISVGTSHSCAVASGAAYCWGFNDGRLGNNSTTQSLTPVAVDTSGVLSGKTVTAISADNGHSCAVASGTVYCWGLNGSGQLGNDSTTQSLVPVAVDTSGVLSGKTVTAISAGNSHSCAVASGAAYCWGFNGNGRLGNDSTTQSLVPVAVDTSGVLSGKTVTAISAGANHSCAVASDTAYCWGSNGNGRLGSNTSVESLIPVATIESISAFIPATAATLKLQYALKSATSCSQQMTGFSDVTTSSAIAWHTNPSVTDGTIITSNASDPTDPANTIYQSFVSEGSSFNNPVAIPVDKFSLWDFSLKDNSGLGNTTYCMKVVYANGANMDIYRIHPEVTTAPIMLTLGFVDNGGSPVDNPSFAMSAANLSPSCQTTTGYIGSTTGNRMRVAQGDPGDGWSMSIAATGGATSLWTRTDSGAYYDFNDASGSPAGCNSGSDGDGLAGQLSVAANSMTISPKSGCTTTGISMGGALTGFDQGVTDALTLLTATSSSGANCYWDLSDLDVSQTLPANQTQGYYELQLTATVVAY